MIQKFLLCNRQKEDQAYSQINGNFKVVKSSQNQRFLKKLLQKYNKQNFNTLMQNAIKIF